MYSREVIEQSTISDGYVYKMIDFEFKNEETQRIYLRMKTEMLEYLSSEAYEMV